MNTSDTPVFNITNDPDNLELRALLTDLIDTDMPKVEYKFVVGDNTTTISKFREESDRVFLTHSSPNVGDSYVYLTRWVNFQGSRYAAMKHSKDIREYMERG